MIYCQLCEGKFYSMVYNWLDKLSIQSTIFESCRELRIGFEWFDKYDIRRRRNFFYC